MYGKIKFLFFVFFSYIGFYDTHGLNIFLNQIIHGVILYKNFLKKRKSLTNNQNKTHCQNRNDNKKNPNQFCSKDKHHDKRKNEHKRSTNGSTKDCHICILKIANIGCHPGNQRRCRKFFDIFKRIALYMMKHILSEIFCKTAGSNSRSFSC